MNDKGHTQKDSRKQVLILGGGIAGLSAARAMDHWGAVVHLVERENCLGGHALEWACMATNQCQNCGACLSAEIVEQGTLGYACGRCDLAGRGAVEALVCEQAGGCGHDIGFALLQPRPGLIGIGLVHQIPVAK